MLPALGLLLLGPPECLADFYKAKAIDQVGFLLSLDFAEFQPFLRDLKGVQMSLVKQAILGPSDGAPDHEVAFVGKLPPGIGFVEAQVELPAGTTVQVTGRAAAAVPAPSSPAFWALSFGGPGGEFHSICGNPVSSGTNVFVANNGGNLGSHFFPGQLEIEVRGVVGPSSIEFSARGMGSAVWSPIAVSPLGTPGSGVRPSIGAANLLPGMQHSFDDLGLDVPSGFPDPNSPDAARIQAFIASARTIEALRFLEGPVPIPPIAEQKMEDAEGRWDIVAAMLEALPKSPDKKIEKVRKAALLGAVNARKQASSVILWVQQGKKAKLAHPKCLKGAKEGTKALTGLGVLKAAAAKAGG